MTPEERRERAFGEAMSSYSTWREVADEALILATRVQITPEIMTKYADTLRKGPWHRREALEGALRALGFEVVE